MTDKEKAIEKVTAPDSSVGADGEQSLCKANRRGEYLRLLLDGKLNEHLYEADEECHARMEMLVEQMKAGAGITEELKATEQMKWIGLMNNVRGAEEEIVLR